MGRLDDIIERNKHPGKHRKARFPMGLAVAVFVLLILVLMIFTDLDESGDKPATEPAATPGEPGERRVRGIELRSAPARTPRDAGAVD